MQNIHKKAKIDGLKKLIANTDVKKKLHISSTLAYTKNNLAD